MKAEVVLVVARKQEAAAPRKTRDLVLLLVLEL